MNKDDGKTHWESCYLDHIECAYDKIIRLEEDNKYLKKVLEERHAERLKNWEIITQLQQENKELKDKLYKYWLKYGPIEAESYVSYERTDYPSDGRG